MMVSIHENGFWLNATSAGHIYDSVVANNILKLLYKYNIKTLLDLGCGTGEYSKKFLANNIQCEAYDGNPNTVNISEGIGQVLDLTNIIDLNKQYDCVLSLEVGEHIPAKYETIFIDNVCKHSKNLIIISWAVVGQGGDGHVNCRNNDYIIKEIERRFFSYKEEESNYLRRNYSNANWFSNTIMVFEKSDASSL